VCLALVGLIIGEPAFWMALGATVTALLATHLTRRDAGGLGQRRLADAVRSGWLATGLIAAAFALYAYAKIDAGPEDCPAQTSSTMYFSPSVSDWPPAARCGVEGDPLTGTPSRVFLEEPHPWIAPVVTLLLIAGAGSLGAAIVLARPRVRQ
jgi:hypothetical protein